MGLKWILNSAFTQVLGLTEKQQQNQKEAGGEGIKNVEQVKEGRDCFYGGDLNFQSGFQMPLHYPRYTKRDYEEMEEGKLDLLLKQYGLCFDGTLEEKRAFAIGTFIWPDQL
ncbi:uncharacterized protein LOC105434788 [Cucumis sativus]|uniref:DUF7722 domain-containing protein n=1 Tax=Cucumis sativus TaxID=3659 RepID=A0A0A0L4U1_CUCSA|nr:uncharacterized protein LOC105434788 [Cucumis sativus]KGN56014.1 hypothetical protein Csa_011328 [Cucumis sativus]